jgi:uncharacterized membrane protein
VEYLIVKWLHILSSTILFGTGIGSAYYMFFGSLSRDPNRIAHVVGLVVIADWVFTTPTILLQPATGLYLIHLMGLSFEGRWLRWSIGLYFLAGAAWLPVVWMQIKMRDMAAAAVSSQSALPAKYGTYFRAWTALGVVAFFALVIVFYLMVAKPV